MLFLRNFNIRINVLYAALSAPTSFAVMNAKRNGSKFLLSVQNVESFFQEYNSVDA
jgi:hypothetical protein